MSQMPLLITRVKLQLRKCQTKMIKMKMLIEKFPNCFLEFQRKAKEEVFSQGQSLFSLALKD
jgi:hypothetical protein